MPASKYLNHRSKAQLPPCIKSDRTCYRFAPVVICPPVAGIPTNKSIIITGWIRWHCCSLYFSAICVGGGVPLPPFRSKVTGVRREQPNWHIRLIVWWHYPVARCICFLSQGSEYQPPPSVVRITVAGLSGGM